MRRRPAGRRKTARRADDAGPARRQSGGMISPNPLIALSAERPPDSRERPEQQRTARGVFSPHPLVAVIVVNLALVASLTLSATA